MDVVYAKATVHAGAPGGTAGLVQKGSHWPADDPVVKANPDLFTADARYGLHFSVEPSGYDAPVEQATAAPGEKRAVRRS
jgi:hypothetical protein